ncbi:MAG: uroporphyrinogen decarboxylase family protein [Planctomycetota bacterium]
MDPRERLLRTISCEEADRVPLYFRLFGFRPPPHLAWKDGVERLKRWHSLGVDDFLGAKAPVAMHPEVTTRSWEEPPTANMPYTVLHKEYTTPAGTITQAVKLADDVEDGRWCRQPEEVQLFDDFNVPRAVKHAVTGPEDLPALRYVLGDIDEARLPECREAAAEAKKLAEEEGSIVVGSGLHGTDAAIWLCGVEGAIMAAVDRPDFFEELLDAIHYVDKRQAEVLLEAGVDMIARRGWYDTTRFWSPTLYRRFIKPRLAELVDMAHQAGIKFTYLMSCGVTPLLDDFIEMGIDLHQHIDPVQGGDDLATVKAKLGGKVASLGGINSAVTLGSGTKDEIRAAVKHAMEVMKPGGGFILSPVDCLFPDTPWESVETLIDAWREVCEY